MNNMLLFTFCLFTTLTANASMFTYMLWSKHDVKVCFLTPTESSETGMVRFSSEQKENIQRWVEEEFSPSRTGIHFVGFADCSETKKPNVIIQFKGYTTYLGWGRVSKAHASIGESMMSVSKEYPSARGKVEVNRLGLNKSVIIHEFGHIAGLFHEHEHPLAKDTCRSTKNKDQIIHMARGYLPYDEDSIMSYCVTKNHKDRGLSEGDIHALRLLYLDQLKYREPIVSYGD